MTKSKNAKKKDQGETRLTQLAARLLAKANPKPKKKKKSGRVTGASMGPVASITTAPVAIGNSVKGSKTVVVNAKNGCTVRGRDFMFTPIGSGSITTWTMVGGTPLAPVAFGDSGIRQYMQMYQKYRWRKCVVYYITSSPTSSSGDVMFYYGKNRDSVFLNQTSSFLLPFVLSDPSTVIGPQWTNHAAVLEIAGTWKSTDYGMGDSLNDYADGEIFLLSKTTTTDSPGYVLFDYEVEFAEMQISPRLLNLPLPRAQYTCIALTTNGAVVAGNEVDFFTSSGHTISGATSALPSGAVIGDVYKIVFDSTNSTFTTGTAANLISLPFNNAATSTLNITDGLTMYAVFDTTANNAISIYPTSTAAYALSGAIVWQTTQTTSVNIIAWISLVGSISNTDLKPSY